MTIIIYDVSPSLCRTWFFFSSALCSRHEHFQRPRRAPAPRAGPSAQQEAPLCHSMWRTPSPRPPRSPLPSTSAAPLRFQRPPPLSTPSTATSEVFSRAPATAARRRDPKNAPPAAMAPALRTKPSRLVKPVRAAAPLPLLALPPPLLSLGGRTHPAPAAWLLTHHGLEPPDARTHAGGRAACLVVACEPVISYHRTRVFS